MKMLILSAILILTQLLSWQFASAIKMLFNVKSRKFNIIFLFIVNIFIVLALMQILPMKGFRVIAIFLTISWFSLIIYPPLKAINHFWAKKNNYKFPIKSLYIIGLTSLISLGLWNAYTPRVVHYTVETSKIMQPVKIAMLADTHLGVLFGNQSLQKLNQHLKQIQPDLILMPGDILDDDTHYFDKEQMHIEFSKITQYPTFITLGNHDFRESFTIIDRLYQAGAIVLNDNVVTLSIKGNQISIVGRLDDMFERRTMQDLTQHTNPENFRIVLDHRPSSIYENMLFADLQVSGHTHNGQVFPANFITKMVYPLAYGQQKFSNMDAIVTSGYGFWGIPFRLGSQSEIVLITLKPSS